MKKTRKQIQKEQTILRNAYVEIAQQTGAIDRITKLMGIYEGLLFLREIFQCNCQFCWRNANFFDT